MAAGVAALLDRQLAFAHSSLAKSGPPVGDPWPPTVDEMINSPDGTPLFVRSGGSGPLNIIFVHGWSCSHQFFGPQFAAVGSEFPFAALDLAGHGRSGNRSQHTVSGFADDVMAVASRLSGSLILVVHSAGGRVACEVASRLGRRLVGIVGIDSFQNLGLPAPTKSQIEAALKALREDFSGRIAQSLSFLLPASADSSLREWIHAQMTATDPAQAIGASAAFAKTDAAAAIAGFDRPVVALNSDSVPTHQDQIQKILPRFSAHILQGQGHFPHLLKPLEFNQLLLSTLHNINQG